MTEYTQNFLDNIYIADTIHDWGAKNSQRVKDPVQNKIVRKYLKSIGIHLENYIKPAASVVYNEIENTYTDYVVENLAMTSIGINNQMIVLKSTPIGSIIDFNNVVDKWGCKSMRVELADSVELNTDAQFDLIGEKIFKYFGVNEPYGELHLIIDAMAGKLNKCVYAKGRPLYPQLFININALNIADSAPTRNSFDNIYYQYFPFNINVLIILTLKS